MSGLANRMLELAKSDDEKDTLLLSEMSVSELTEQTVLQFEPVAFEKKVSIASNVMPEVRIKTNKESFIRLLHILLDNAIKYSRSSGVVSIQLTRERQGFRLCVKNEGSLITQEDLPHIFERFYRTDKTRSSSGYGLGLSIAKSLAEDLGGKIRAESDEGNGTRFTVFLKAIKQGVIALQ